MATLRSLRALPRLSTRTVPARSFTNSSRLSDYARMNIIGRLGAPPEATQTSTGKSIVRYVVASGYGPRDNRSTSWFNITNFVEENERGESRSQYLASLEKGTLVFVEAEGQMRTYTTEDGKTQKALSLIHRSIQVLAKPLNRAAEADSEDAAPLAANA